MAFSAGQYTEQRKDDRLMKSEIQRSTILKLNDTNYYIFQKAGLIKLF